MKKTKEPKVFIDTSLILFALERRLDLFEAIDEALGKSYRAIIPEEVISELKRLSQNKHGLATVALEFLKKNKEKYDVIRSAIQKPVDEILLELAAEQDGIVATADNRLARRARRMKLSVLMPWKSRRKLILLCL
ncbi:MAG: hypothetical protein DRJ46_01880 [Thermoprotei archaeon]|nr:MAG: hypothetical protein DRJ46_01880 [Thermoprotei archaeon]